MVTQTKDLWSLALDHQQIDPQDLTAAIEDQVIREDLDYRSRVLIRDSLKALRHYWGPQRVQTWLEASPVGQKIESICNQEFECDRGFPSLMRRVVDVTRPEAVRQFLRELGSRVDRPVRLDVGGSIALILPEYISRRTEDVDVVDEVPAELRCLHQELSELKKRYGLGLAHFQSHYLPRGWEQRVNSQELFGQLRVFLVDVYDVFLSKLFHARTKDLDDLRHVAPQLDKETLVRKLKETAVSLLAQDDLRPKAEHNWYILFGEPLPS